MHCPNGHLGQDLDFGGFDFTGTLMLPELLNTKLGTVREKLGQTSSLPNGPQIWFSIGLSGNELGAQLGPMSIAKLSPDWACQMDPIHFSKLCCLGGLADVAFLCTSGSRTSETGGGKFSTKFLNDLFRHFPKNFFHFPNKFSSIYAYHQKFLDDLYFILSSYRGA